MGACPVNLASSAWRAYSLRMKAAKFSGLFVSEAGMVMPSASIRALNVSEWIASLSASLSQATICGGNFGGPARPTKPL
jgi:hypothetical protein